MSQSNAPNSATHHETTDVRIPSDALSNTNRSQHRAVFQNALHIQLPAEIAAFDHVVSPVSPHRRSLSRISQNTVPWAWTQSSRSYFRFVSDLSAYLPHLKILRSHRWRHKHAGRIRVMDIEAPRGFQEFVDLEIREETLNASLRQWLDVELPREAATRLFIIEDLCPISINSLWYSFRYPNPELFAAHINRAGTHEKSYEDQHPRDWRTLTHEKRYNSIRWLRSGFYMKGSPFDQPENVRKLLKSGKLRLRGDEDGFNPHETFFNFSSPEKTVIENPERKLGTTSNIVRQFKSLSTDANPSQGDTIPCLWEERATVLVGDDTKFTNLLLLLDPLPKFALIETPSDVQSTGSDDMASMPSASVSVSMIANNPLERTEVLPYDPVRRRRHPGSSNPDMLNVGTINLNILDELERAQIPASTAEDILSSLRYAKPTSRYGSKQDPIRSLLVIIATDLADTFETMSNNVLQHIIDGSLDEILVQERLHLWRKIMNYIEHEIPLLTQDFEEFALAQKRSDISDFVLELITDVRSRGDKVMKKLRRTESNLRADMSLLESRRGIEEAESVSRLTELAFIFIPLTFVSSLFSMQINELSKGVPATTVVIAGSMLTVSLYSIRIIIRSRPFTRFKRSLLNSARTYNNLAPGKPIPFRGFIRYCLSGIIWGQGYIWTWHVLLTAIGLSIAPIVLIWQRDALDLGFKIAMTLTFVTWGVVMFIASYINFDPDASWLPANVSQRIGRRVLGRETPAPSRRSGLGRRPSRRPGATSIVTGSPAYYSDDHTSSSDASTGSRRNRRSYIRRSLDVTFVDEV